MTPVNQVVAYKVRSIPECSTLSVQDSSGNYHESPSLSTILAFLRYSQSGVIRVFWDLDESIAPILRLLPLSTLKSLAHFDSNTSFENHQLYYLPDRMFRIGKSRFFGIKGFWPTTEPSPKTIEDTRDRAQELITTLARCEISGIRKLTSPIAVFEDSELGRDLYDSLPKACDIPEPCWESLEYAYKCDRKEWISAYQLGYFPAGGIWDYDMNATYPSIARDLPDIREMRVWKSEYMNYDEYNADFGFLHGRLHIHPDHYYSHLSPVVADAGGIPGNPTGGFDDFFITLDEVRHINQNDLGCFQIRDGWFFAHNDSSRSVPFDRIMTELYNKRTISPLASSICKNISNQLVGKLIETRVDGDYGAIRNDVYHATILARARIKLSRFLLDNQVASDELVVVQTDGCRLTRFIPSLNGCMGGWRCNGTENTIVASPYRVYTADRRPGQLTYNDVIDVIDDHPLSSYYGHSVKHRITLKQALQRDDIGSVGTDEDVPISLDLYSLPREQNRVFNKLPTTGKALITNKYSSLPVVLGQ